MHVNFGWRRSLVSPRANSLGEFILCINELFVHENTVTTFLASFLFISVVCKAWKIWLDYFNVFKTIERNKSINSIDEDNFYYMLQYDKVSFSYIYSHWNNWTYSTYLELANIFLSTFKNTYHKSFIAGLNNLDLVSCEKIRILFWISCIWSHCKTAGVSKLSISCVAVNITKIVRLRFNKKFRNISNNM